MASNKKFEELADKSLSEGSISSDDIRWILESPDTEILSLLNATNRVRHKYFKNNVKIHILHNVQSGNCSEDCKYCTQSKESKNKDATYPMKSDEEILDGAKAAYEAGAYRHCMVFSGRGIGGSTIERICSIVENIKSLYPMEICVSAGFLNNENADKLVKAGVNRYNHNLNTSSCYYTEICTTHDIQKRVNTIKTAKSRGLDICSGVIIGMGESHNDIIKMIGELRDVKADSIPVNFFIPVPGHRIENFKELTPHYCLKVLCAFRLAIPGAELRSAAGREYHLRSLQPLCLYAVNSIFAEGYLTTGGDKINSVKQMIEDNGFVIEKIEH